MDSIDRQILFDLMKRWRSREYDEKALHEAAESIWEGGGEWPQYSKDDPRSIAIEVLSNLDVLNQQLIGKEDIPAIEMFLSTAEGKELEGWQNWEEYWSEVDYAERETQRGTEGYYRGKDVLR